jgi:hypothetical protein
MPPFFNHFHGRKTLGRSEDQYRTTRRHKGRPSAGYYQREAVDRPNRVVIVVGIRGAELSPMLLDRSPVDAVEVGVNHRRMVVIGSRTRMNVLKGSYKKCQQECEACL